MVLGTNMNLLVELTGSQGLGNKGSLPLMQ
jgi:hypothetical protein